jgi:large subunit ribosomal protein L23
MSVISSKTKETKSPKVVGGKKGAYAHVLSAPRVTEKSAFSGDKGAYVFNVAPNATKVDIKKAFAEVYGIMPLKVTITRIPKKPTMVRGQRGTKGGGKKATVFLAPGQKIDIV